MNLPEEIFIIFDPFNSPHIFKSETQAIRFLTKLQEESMADSDDTVWDLQGPFKYKLDKSE